MKYSRLNRIVVAVAATLALGGCESIFGIDDAPDETLGYVFYINDTSGQSEVWAVPDTGGTPVRLTDGMSAGTTVLPGLAVSRDGRRLAVASALDASGTPQDGRFIWVMDADGAHREYLVDASPNVAFFGMTWQGDNRHLVYANEVACSNNILRIDAEVGGAPETLYDVEDIAVEPAINPVDANAIIFAAQVCGEQNSMRRLDVASGEVTTVPDTVDYEGRFRFARWSSDGTRLTYTDAETGRVYVHDLQTEREVYAVADPDEFIGNMKFGNDDLRLYGKYCSAAGECDLAVLDPETGTLTPLSVPGITPDTPWFIDWAPRTLDLDVDDDGLGNAIDPD